MGGRAPKKTKQAENRVSLRRRRRRSKRRARPPRTRRRASARLRKGFVRMHIVVMAPVGQVVSHAPGLATVEQRLLLPRAEKRRRPENHACQTALHVRSYRLVGSGLLGCVLCKCTLCVAYGFCSLVVHRWGKLNPRPKK